MGFCSPRNELESLYTIFSLVDKSKSNDQQTQPKVFQDLRIATLDLIHKFGNTKLKEDVKVLSSPNLEKEKCLLQWGESNGVKSRLAIACKFSLLLWKVWFLNTLELSLVFSLKCVTKFFSFNLISCHVDFEGAGRGAIASEDLEVGDIALEIPSSVIIAEDLVHKTSMVC